MPVNIASISQVTKNRKKFLCAKKEDMYIHGSYNSKTARLVNIQLRRCRGRTDCKTDEEIKDFFRNKYLLILQNQVRFETKYFGEEAII